MLVKTLTLAVPDRALHIIILMGGMLLWSVLKGGFDWIADKFWRKVDKEAEDLKAFKAWKKAGSPKA